MCGIVGFAGFVNPQLLSRMSAAVAHRGPDSQGDYCSLTDTQAATPADAQPVSLAARRLSIMDPAGGDQPMTTAHAALVFNGEIYNDADLRDELRSAGCEFRTAADTEVILRGYERWGIEGLLPRLNGMFAFAIYDLRSGELWLARDRTGQKPMYYAQRDGRLLFGSEIKALLESDLVERKLNHAAVDQYLTLRYVPQPHTLLTDVSVLPGGHFLRWQQGSVSLHRFWKPTIVEESRQGQAELLDELTDLFDAAIERTLRSDVPVGAYLSGGVDSGLLVSSMTAAAIRGLPFSRQTYSVGFGAETDEIGHAAELARSLDIQNKSVRLGVDALAELPRVLWHLERPIGEPLILAYDALARTASGDVKAVFSGEGADELFAGYSFHRVLRFVEQVVGSVPGAGAALPILLQALPVSVLNRLFTFPAYLGGAGKQRVVSFARRYRQRHLGQNYAALRSLFDTPQRAGLYSTSFQQEASEEWLHREAESLERPLERLLNLQYHDWLQDFALLRQDKLSMAHGLEVRLPFLDNTLIDFAAKLPANCKLRRSQNKVLLRQLAASRLPAAVAKRQKQAFYFPLESMYHDPAFQQLLQRTLDRETINRRGIFDAVAVQQLCRRAQQGEFLLLKQVMSLVMLELWMQIFLDNEKLW